MKTSSLYKFTYIYQAIPLLLFLLNWLDYGWAVVFCGAFCFAFYKVYSSIKSDDVEIVSYNSLLGIIGIATIWCFLAGIGYFYHQPFDYHFRNAVFRDLINYEWPVFYDKANTPMVYYMGYWLFPALFGKFALWVGLSSYNAFIFANIILFMYAVFGVTVVLIHMLKAVKANSNKQIWLAVVIFILFSGMDIVGDNIIKYHAPFEYHLEWWASFIQYSSITTMLFWIFNQFIPVALITFLVFNERNIKNFGFLIAISLFMAPYPTAGIGVFMLMYFINLLLQQYDNKSFILNEVFSLQNLVGVFWLLPIEIIFYITNSEGMRGYYPLFEYTTVRNFLIFVALEFLIYSLIIGKKFYKDVFFISLVVMLLFIPFLRVDEQNNFCMRASIPEIILLAVYCIKFLFENKNKYLTLVLGCLLLIGMVTPVTEFYRGFYYTSKAGRINLVADEIFTLNKSFVRMPIFGWDANHQYTAKKYETDVFWQFFAKKHKPDGK